MMERNPVVWVPVPDEEDPDDFDRSLTFEVVGQWFGVDQDQLILPIEVVERDGESVDESFEAILKQYGGEALLNDMLLSEQTLEPGSTWTIGYQEGRGRYVFPIED